MSVVFSERVVPVVANACSNQNLEYSGAISISSVHSKQVCGLCQQVCLGGLALIA